MPRPRERVCLQDGLKLDLNGLAQNGFIKRGANIGSRGIRWTHSYWGEIATGMISADMSGRDVRSSLDRNDVNRNGRLRVLASTALTPTGKTAPAPTSDLSNFFYPQGRRCNGRRGKAL